MQSIWGSSSKDVYICGYNDASGGKLYHFDGSVWREIRLDFLQHPPQLDHLHGTSKSDIWAVGYTLSGIYDSVAGTWKIVDSSFAMHYNGSEWQEYKIVGGRELTNVLAISQTDVWACGVASSLFHFNGTNWTQVSIPGNYLFTSLAATSPSDVYLVGNQSESTLPMDSTGYYLFHKDGMNWTKVDSVMEHPGAPPPHFGRGLWSTGSSVYSLSPGVFRKTSTAWVQLSDIPVGHMYQVTPSKMIAVGKSVYQFDGSNWTELTQFAAGPGMVWFDCFADSSEAFVVGSNNSFTVMLHGM